LEGDVGRQREEFFHLTKEFLPRLSAPPPKGDK